MHFSLLSPDFEFRTSLGTSVFVLNLNCLGGKRVRLLFWRSRFRASAEPIFLYRINNELVLNSQNESTYLEGPLGPERG